jgi:hypothetical protein
MSKEPKFWFLIESIGPYATNLCINIQQTGNSTVRDYTFK